MGTDISQDLQGYLRRIEFPVSKEELINGLLESEAVGDEIVLVERLPQDEYADLQSLQHDLDDVSRVRSAEVDAVTDYNGYLELVVKHVGDVRHANKHVFNRTVDAIVGVAHRRGRIDAQEVATLRPRLESEFSRLRGSMTDVTNDDAPNDPADDLPSYRTEA